MPSGVTPRCGVGRSGKLFTRVSRLIDGRRMSILPISPERTVKMTQRVAVQNNTSRSPVRPKDKRDELTEGFTPLPGELVATDKVEEVLETLYLPPVTDAEPRLDASAEEIEPAAEDEEEPIEESISPEDPVRLYLREIGRIPLLTSEQEVELGQRMERGQARVRRAIMAVPMVRAALIELGERLRKREAAPEQFLEALDGTELGDPELRRVLGVFA